MLPANWNTADALSLSASDASAANCGRGLADKSAAKTLGIVSKTVAMRAYRRTADSIAADRRRTVVRIGRTTGELMEVTRRREALFAEKWARGLSPVKRRFPASVASNRRTVKWSNAVTNRRDESVRWTLHPNGWLTLDTHTN